MGGGVARDERAKLRLVEPVGQAPAQHALGVVADHPTFAPAFARNHQNASIAAFTSMDDEPTKRGAGLHLGHAMKIKPPAQIHLSAPDPSVRGEIGRALPP